ncbi:(+)-neomenthol dehydrogenase-like [Rhodamnia argentea]|uniref:Short-chain dehydrogenase/reductase n=1 Tax=Rhodamnia argentea TaxID=178133 RepID=A0ABM3HYE5_9MYRT|nr:(+)-neomenthol dehydrogenase-like [Rhodamnia argentea]
MAESTKRYAVITGANKGIGLEICRQLASNGIVVVLTSRDEKRGLEAVQKLKDSGLSDYVLFHQLDVTDPSSVVSLAKFIETRIGKLDILVNNAGVVGATVNYEAFRAAGFLEKQDADAHARVNWREAFTQSLEGAKTCIETNYHGSKRMVEAHIGLLQRSNSPRIVNVSSIVGKHQYVSDEWAKGVLSDIENLTEDKVDEVVNVYLENFKNSSSAVTPAYIISKAAINAYTRILAKKFPGFLINCVCPGAVRTDINGRRGILSMEEGAESPVKLALLPSGGPTGCFFIRKEQSEF